MVKNMVCAAVRMVRDKHAELREEEYVGTHNPPALITMKAHAIQAITQAFEADTRELTESRKLLAHEAALCDSQALASRLNILAKHEGRLHVFAAVLGMTGTEREEGIQEWLLDQALKGADDSWSGRNNDIARSRYDGVLSAIREVRLFTSI